MTTTEIQLGYSSSKTTKLLRITFTDVLGFNIRNGRTSVLLNTKNYGFSQPPHFGESSLKPIAGSLIFVSFFQFLQHPTNQPTNQPAKPYYGRDGNQLSDCHLRKLNVFLPSASWHYVASESSNFRNENDLLLRGVSMLRRQ